MRLAALEKNILVYRAIEMALFLFYAEDMRNYLIQVVARGPNIQKQEPKDLKGGKLMKRIFERLVREKLLSEAESKELQELIGHRDKIAHSIHRLTGDIELPKRNRNFRYWFKLEYDYTALKRLKKWREEIPKRLKKNYFGLIAFEPLMFEAAEHAYQRELLSLKRRIEIQIAVRKAKG